MPENSKQPPQPEVKEKLKEIRASYTRAKKLISEIEKSHAIFTRIRETLTNKDNGVKANFQWLADQRAQIGGILTDARKKLEELEAVASSIQSEVNEITQKYTSFTDLAKQIFDESEGLEAVLKATRKLKANTDKLAEKIAQNSTDAHKKLNDIIATTQKVAEAYTAFLEKKKLVDDEENGLEAQLRRATDGANKAVFAKTKAESALLSVTKFKEKSEELVSEIGESKKTVEDYQNESKELTDDIRNTLNKATQFTLSQALQDRTKKLTRQMRWWAGAQAIAIIGLTAAVCVIFYALFFHNSDANTIAARLQDGPTLVSVVSKILFTTPLVYAVYFTTTNYGHARDLRDKYAWKETVAKNFQNYIKLVKDEFKDSDNDKRYEEERFKFSMETIRSIYSEPNPIPKKRKYNFSLYNKIFRARIEEEDLIELKEALTGTTETVDSSGSKGLKSKIAPEVTTVKESHEKIVTKTDIK